MPNSISDVGADNAHVPVLCGPFVELLVQDVDGAYVDATFGRGGHARSLLERLSAKGRLLALDRDPEAVAAGLQLAKRDKRFCIVHKPFSHMDEALAEVGWEQVDGIGFDLGVSSPQLDQPERGFSFQFSGPLDMRMDPSNDQPLSWRLQHTNEKELARVLREYGDERYASRIARSILRALGEGELVDTRALENVCYHAVPRSGRHGRIHPATRTFQALRMWVNEEVAEIEQGLAAAVRHLRAGGRMAVISFHSGEDRLVRDAIDRQVNPCTCPSDFPMCICGKRPTMKWVQKKPLRASEAEVNANPRARSARMRVAERLA